MAAAVIKTPIVVSKKDDGIRLDKLLLQTFPAASFGLIQRMCRTGQIRLDGKRVKGNERIAAGQEVRIPPPLLYAADHAAEGDVVRLSAKDLTQVRSWILYEDADIVVVNKPYGLPVQGGTGHTKSLDKMMEGYAAAHGGTEENRPRLVHRIDKTTTGCVVLAKSRAAAAVLAEQFATHHIEKTYWAVGVGELKKKQGVVRTAMFKGVGTAEEGAGGALGAGREKMHAVSLEEGDAWDGGRFGSVQEAVTAYRQVSRTGALCWLEVQPETGRMHQIRVHMAELGVPLLGDVKYGGAEVGTVEDFAQLAGVTTEEHLKLPPEDLNGLRNKVFLHAQEVVFSHPETGETCRIEATLPAHFERLFGLVGWSAEV